MAKIKKKKKIYKTKKPIEKKIFKLPTVGATDFGSIRIIDFEQPKSIETPNLPPWIQYT